RAAEGDEILERMTAKHLQPGFEKRLRRDIRLHDIAVRRDGQNRMRQGVQDRLVQNTGIRVGLWLRDAHAACFHAKSSNASQIPCLTLAGSDSARSFARQLLISSGVRFAVCPAACSVQPICLRASRTPRAMPYCESHPS